MPVKPIIATNPQTGEKLQLINNAWVPMQDPATAVPKVDPTQFADAQASLEDIQGIKGRANGLNTGTIGWMLGKVGGTPAYNLKADILPIQARGMLGKLMQLKANSPQGASGLGALSEQEGELLRSTIGNLDIGQSTDQFTKNLGRAEELIARSYPGLTQNNAIDLSAGQSRTTIPKGAYYKDKDGNIRRNDNMDKGNPIIVPRGGNVAKGVKASSANNLKAKYGLE